jgi:1,4-alpha-glucan branching enzyme
VAGHAVPETNADPASTEGAGPEDAGSVSQSGNPPSDHVVVALNFTPVPREGYRIGVPSPGSYREVFNSDAVDFGGSGVASGPEAIIAEPVHWMNLPHSVVLTLPPLAGIVLKPTAPTQAEQAAHTD